MFERFTEHARHVMALANQEAQRFGHGRIETEHILWGLAKENEGVAAAVLEHFNVDLKPLRQEVEALLQNRAHPEDVEKLPQSPHARDVVVYAIEEARSLHHNYIGTEHLLLGLLRNSATVAAQVLVNLGLQLDAVREQVRKATDETHANG